MAGRKISLLYKPTSQATTNFVFSTIYSVTTYTFTVHNSKIYTFPLLLNTASTVTPVTVGQQVTFTSTFDATLPSTGMTTTISIKPSTQNAVVVSPPSITGGTTISYLFTVSYDENHSGAINLIYGTATKAYAWTAALPDTVIYSFPSSFGCSGPDNALDPGTLV